MGVGIGLAAGLGVQGEAKEKYGGYPKILTTLNILNLGNYSIIVYLGLAGFVVSTVVNDGKCRKRKMKAKTLNPIVVAESGVGSRNSRRRRRGYQSRPWVCRVVVKDRKMSYHTMGM